jgi:hypothetical protein
MYAVCQAKHSRLQSTIDELQKQRAELEVVDLSSQAACVVAMKSLPAKATPVIKTLLKALRAEENDQLHRRTYA